MKDTQWMAEAICRQVDPELFHPETSGQGARQQAQQAKAVCRECPVRQECFTFAVETGQRHGVWGGELLSSSRFRGKRAGTMPPKPIEHGTAGGYAAHLRRGIPTCAACREGHNQYGRERERQLAERQRA